MSLRSVLAMICAIVVTACATATPEARPPRAPESGDASYYLAMRDGVRLALNLYFPGGAPPETRAPAILIQTRYGRALESRRGGTPRDIDYFLDAGFVVAIIDTRGSTSSFGPRDVEMGPDEREDMDEIIAHLAAAPWSDGRVVAYGVSYMADTAAFAATRRAPGLVASIPRQLDFDAYVQGFMPGGVQNDYLLYVWGNYTKTVDSGLSPTNEAFDCRARVDDCSALFPILQPVDGDTDYALLREALNGRHHWSPEDYINAPFRDDPGANGYSLFDFSPVVELEAWRRENKPMMVWGSWLDGPSADAALSLYRSAPELPLEIWITANNHGHNLNADPFNPARTTPAPNRDEQMDAVLNFIGRTLAHEPIERRIHYFVMGAETFRDTREWPPLDVEPRTLFLGPQSRLVERAPRTQQVRYTVDFDAGTGENTRWSTQFGPAPAYADRREVDQRLIVFDSEPMTEDMELVGQAVIDLWLSVSRDDAAVFAYIEDVAPDGRVTYITEGQLRAIHRAPADPATLPFDQGPAPHSFARADALPVTPNELMNMRFALNPTAALIRQGHRVRVAIAGADANVFRRYPAEGDLEFTIQLGGRRSSRVELPMRSWTAS